MKVLLDTNIYLNFYRRKSGQHIKSLDVLSKMVSNNEIVLLLPKQIEDEFVRNKHAAAVLYTDQIEVLGKELTIGDAEVPSFLKSFPAVRSINSLRKRIAREKKKLIEEYKSRVSNPRSRINQKVTALQKCAIKDVETPEVLQKAYFRTLRGNPPRKANDSFGDAIIWETILENHTDDDLTLISGDGDYASERDGSEINEFLLKEWQNKTDRNIKLFSTLGAFLNEREPKKKNVPVPAEEIEEESGLYNLPHMTFQAANLPLSYAIYNPRINVTTGFNTKICSCCGTQFESKMRFSLNYSSDKCKRCQNNGPAAFCSQCGQHFHRDSFSLTTDVMNCVGSNICGECKRTDEVSEGLYSWP